MNWIICEMYKDIIYIVGVKLFTTSPDISFMVPISFQNPINTCDKQEMSNIKFSFIIQKRIRNIFLKYITFIWLLFDNLYYILNCSYFYSLTPVTILSWLNYPFRVHVLWIISKKSFEFRIILIFYAICNGYNLKWILFEIARIVMEYNLEKFFLLSYAAIFW